MINRSSLSAINDRRPKLVQQLNTSGCFDFVKCYECRLTLPSIDRPDRSRAWRRNWSIWLRRSHITITRTRCHHRIIRDINCARPPVFPTPVGPNRTFNPPINAAVQRVTGWRLPRLPFMTLQMTAADWFFQFPSICWIHFPSIAPLNSVQRG